MAREAAAAEAQFRAKFRLDELTVHESADWTLSVRPGQPVLGSLVISTRHAALDFAQLPPAAGPGLLTLIGRAEAAAREHFGAVRMNALCLMMQDPLFHFHLLPRAGQPQQFGGHEWTDSGWPGPPNLGDNQATHDAELQAIRAVYAAVDWEELRAGGS
ncbi:MAG TPA: HIT family protein [Acidimicrobiia bacterium]